MPQTTVLNAVAKWLPTALCSRFDRLSLRGQLLALYLIGLPVALLNAALQPMWSPLDEAAHFDLVAQYAHGVYPIEAVTKIRPETLLIMERTGRIRWEGPDGPQPALPPARWVDPPAGVNGHNLSVWARRYSWQFSNEAIQPPVYYALATPLWAAADAVRGPFAAAYSLRVLNALLAGLLSPLGFLLARQLWPGDRRKALVSGLMVAWIPGLMLQTTHVSNDGPAAVVGAAVLLGAIHASRLPPSSVRAVGIGVAVGLATLVKLNAIALAPAVALAIWQASSGRTVVQRLITVGTAAAAGSLPLGAWVASNFIIYRAPTAAGAAAVLNGAGLRHPVLPFNPFYAFISFWSGEPIDRTTSMDMGLDVIIWMIALVGLTGLIYTIVRRSRDPALDAPALGVLVASALGVTLLAFALPIASHDDYPVPGRYLMPAAVAVVLLLLVGLSAFRWPRGLTWAGPVVLVGVGAGITVIRALAWTAPPPEPLRPPISAARSVAAEASYGPLHITVDEVALESGPGQRNGAWLFVTARNTGGTPVDWTPKPVLVQGSNLVATTDYRSGAKLLETLQPGQETSGWLHFWVGPAEFHWVDGTLLVFGDIAEDDYRRVGRATVNLAVGG